VRHRDDIRRRIRKDDFLRAVDEFEPNKARPVAVLM
jgi:hypothetical protein